MKYLTFIFLLIACKESVKTKPPVKLITRSSSIDTGYIVLGGIEYKITTGTVSMANFGYDTLPKVKKKSWATVYDAKWKPIRITRMNDYIVDHDTLIVSIMYDTIPCAIYIMKCDTCEPVIHAAFRVNADEMRSNTHIYKSVDSGVQLGYQSGTWNNIGYKSGSKFLKYIRYDKTEFDKSVFIIKEKILP